MITKEEVEHIGWLCRIRLTEEGAEEFASEMSTVLDYFGQLDEVDTSGVEPTYHVADVLNVFRDDEPAASLPQEDVLGNPEESKDGYIRAPRIM
jgi:aspartyl-tRNA(Asn)/glutamyl-tRNA(Gln) amidotransferase subunit C